MQGMNEFFEHMRSILGDVEFGEFVKAFDEKPRHKALRVNTLKISVADFVALAEKYERSGVREYKLKSNPLCAQSFYTAVKPSLDPLYHAGLYYMQEPSASAAVAAFAPYIGERVLDLCAAPGGKSTQAAAFMARGTLFCNDVEPDRVRALSENIVRLGVKNAVVTNATAHDYRKAGFDGYFDTLIIDAPCSGGGMMRYENVPYSTRIVKGCAERQREILDDAAELVCRGGHLLYSTCTFAPEENEDNVHYLESKGFKTVATPLLGGEVAGVDCTDARRIYPHNFDGEGHFYCVLEKQTGETRELPLERFKPATVKIGGLDIECETVRDRQILPIEVPPLRGLNVWSVGIEVFERTAGKSAQGGKARGRMHDREISHALTHALTREQVELVGGVEVGGDAELYIRGEQIYHDAPRGAVIVTVDGFAIGRARSAPDGCGEYALKNLYPKYLRI